MNISTPVKKDLHSCLPLEVHGPHREPFLGPTHSESRLSEGHVLTGSQLDE